MARRYQLLSKEIAELDEQLDRLVAKAAPQLIALTGVGTDHAATLLTCVVRMRHDQRTKEYVARRTAEGKSKREIIRCLKRYIAREIYRLLAPIAAASPPTAVRP